MFTYLRERVCVQVSRGRGRQRGERIPSRLYAVSTEPDVGLDPTNYEIMIWVKIKSGTLNLLSHPGAPKEYF